jgi:hypothetical protein
MLIRELPGTVTLPLRRPPYSLNGTLDSRFSLSRNARSDASAPLAKRKEQSQ